MGNHLVALFSRCSGHTVVTASSEEVSWQQLANRSSKPTMVDPVAYIYNNIATVLSQLPPWLSFVACELVLVDPIDPSKSSSMVSSGEFWQLLLDVAHLLLFLCLALAPWRLLQCVYFACRPSQVPWHGVPCRSRGTPVVIQLLDGGFPWNNQPAIKGPLHLGKPPFDEV